MSGLLCQAYKSDCMFSKYQIPKYESDCMFSKNKKMYVPELVVLKR